MRPDDIQQNGRVGTPQSAVRSYMSTPPSRDPQYRQQEAAANIVRAQIESIYSSAAGTEAPQAQTTATPQPQATVAQTPRQVQPQVQKIPQVDITSENPYERTHSKQATIQPDQWKAYHSAWQDYYKRYYEGYYTQQVASAKRSFETSQASSPQATITPEPKTATPSAGPVTRKQAMQDLKSKLLTQVEASAKKARKSRHFVPIVAALAVLVIFCFLQYNQVLIANVRAYISPGTIDPQNIIVDPSSTVQVGPEPRLIIPKINVDTPVFYDIPTTKAAQDKAMEDGVAHFAIPGANSHPGEIGNTVLSGHSSNDVFARGDYKFIFMQLDKLQVGDTIYANYNSVRYTYTVTKKREVNPSDVAALTYDTDKPELTLITCTPLGTALRRLLVTAEQVYPTTSKPAPTSNGAQAQTSIPGQGQPTLMERLFGN
jgi:sortase A